jgi:Holliday junction DNA helicase RuvA
MYHHLSGRLVAKNPTFCVVECAGVGYHVNISLNTFEKLGSNENVKLYTHLIVREDAMTLYGFYEPVEREIFERLLSVNGVGANTARLILSSLSPDDEVSAIQLEQVDVLKSVKGIGAKSAQRIIIDLKDKISVKDSLTGSETGPTGTAAIRLEAVSALEVLGFSKVSIEREVGKLLASDPTMNVETVVKLALQKL